MSASDSRPVGQWSRRMMIGCVIVMLAACATIDPGEPRPTGDTAPRSGAMEGIALVQVDAALEQSLTRRAQAAELAGRWHEAAVSWEVLRLVNPQGAHLVKKIQEAQERSLRVAKEHSSLAREARKRGDNRRAMALYLKALVANPEHDEAIIGAREVARSRALNGSHGGRGAASPRERSAGGRFKPGPVMEDNAVAPR